MPDPTLDSSQQPPSHNEATIDAPTLRSHDSAAPPSSCNDATVDAPPDASGDADFQYDSSNDVTIDAPPSQDEMIDPPSRRKVDRLSTHVKEIEDITAEDAALGESGEGSAAAARAKVTVANYEILGVLGRGAVGVVYKARQLGLNRLVALKMLLAGTHAGQRELTRFRIEAEAVARLRHPNIVQVFEVGDHNGLPFFSLEFVEGGSLHQKMGGKPLPPRQAAEILEALARAMHYAHERNIIHRDLKPANVLLTTDGIPKITDFGLAKRLEEGEESSQTRTGTLMGTPSYMSPEQALGRTHDVGPLSDQYTLGAILYEMLTGRPPFLGATMLETIQQVRTREPVPPKQLQPTTPRDLEVICLKSLQKEPGKRYADAREMADDVRRFLNGEPIRARPVSLWERSWRWCRRNPRLAYLYTTVFFLTLLVLVTSGVLTVRNLREQQAVENVRKQAEVRMKESTKAIYDGDVRRAKDLLSQSLDPLWGDAAGLEEQRNSWENLKESIEKFGRFKDLLDKARFAYIYGVFNTRKQMEQGQDHCQQLLKLYDGFAHGITPRPPLNPEQEQLYKEDTYDMYLLTALIEDHLVQNAETAKRRQVAQQALDWLNRANSILPGTRTFHAHRSGFLATLGQREAADAELTTALAIQPTSAVDHFWHGYAEHLRGNGDSSKGDAANACEHYRQEIAEYAALLRQHPAHFWGYFDWAVAKTNLGELQDALIGFTTCIRLRPDYPWPYNNRGTIHLRLRQYDRAMRDYNKALEEDPDYVLALANRALVHLEQKNIDQALEDCNRALEKDPRHSDVYLHRAECYRLRKQYEDALADCFRLLESSKFKDEVHRKRAAIYEDLKRSGDDARYKKALEQDHTTAFELYKQAGQHYKRGEQEQALTEYTAAIELHPRVAEPYRDRGVVCWLYFRDFDAALNDFRKVTELWRSKAEAYRFMGMIHLERRQYDLALEDLEDALARQPGYPDALWGKAQIYLWQGKAKEALEVIDPLASKPPPDAVETLNVRGDIYRRLGRLGDAAADYRRIMKLRPELPEAYVSLALVHCQQGEPDKARQCLNQLVEANPKSATTYLQRGRFLRDQGLFDEAWQDSERARECNAASVLPALLQASITAARGDPTAAVTVAEDALSQAPQVRGQVVDGQVLYAAVQVCSLACAAATRAGRAELAQRCTDRAVELLTRTMEKGYQDLNYPEHNRMMDDPALEAIRKHAEASELIAHCPAVETN